MQETLNAQQRAIIPIAAFAAGGAITPLTTALNAGLDSGLTVNTIKEILVQVYAYAGFPRSLNALATLMDVVGQRQRDGRRVESGRPATEASQHEDLTAIGARNQTRLVGQPVSGPLFDFAPVIDRFLKAHLFGAIFQRDVPDWAMRELATLAMLAVLPGVESQLKSHYAMSLNAGLNIEQLRAFIGQLRQVYGVAVARRAARALNAALPQAAVDDLPEQAPADASPHALFNGDGLFGKGPRNEAYARYFQGVSYLNMLSTEGVTIGNVVFEPGCRNHWHIHHQGGQILLITDGRGWYQQWQQPARALSAGDVVHIPAGVKHWHGAARDSWFAHLAVEVPAAGAKTEWLEPVAEEDYQHLP